MPITFERKAITSGGSIAVTIPKEICTAYKITPGSELEIQAEGNRITVFGKKKGPKVHLFGVGSELACGENAFFAKATHIRGQCNCDKCLKAADEAMSRITKPFENTQSIGDIWEGKDSDAFAYLGDQNVHKH